MDDTILKQKQRREKDTIQQLRIKKYFGKPKLNSITAVEYKEHGIIIQSSSKIQVERAIMKENSKRFQLAYSLPLFEKSILEQIGYFSEKYPAYQLIHNNTPIKMNDKEL